MYWDGIVGWVIGGGIVALFLWGIGTIVLTDMANDQQRALACTNNGGVYAMRVCSFAKAP